MQRAKHVQRVEIRQLPAQATCFCLWFLMEWEDRVKGHFFKFLAHIAEASKILAADFHAAK